MAKTQAEVEEPYLTMVVEDVYSTTPHIRFDLTEKNAFVFSKRLSYKVNDGDWQFASGDYDYDEEWDEYLYFYNCYLYNLKKGDRIYFKAQVNSEIQAYYIGTFSVSGIKYGLCGNAMSMLYWDDAKEKGYTMPSYTGLAFLFEDNSGLVYVSRNFLPATNLRCLRAYCGMFYNCTNLKNVDLILPASVKERDEPYAYMFEGCISLVSAPEMTIDSISSYGCIEMFKDCRSLVDVSKITLNASATQSYKSMFESCVSLQKSPIITADATRSSCFEYMFRDCNKLNHITMLGAWSTYSCFWWVYGVASSGTFVKKKGVSIASGVNGIPNGWTVVEVD